MPFSARQLLIPTSVAVLLLGVAFQRYWNAVKTPHEDTPVAPAVDEREILPTNVTPTHYALRLKPDLQKLTFDGTVDVTLTVNQDTSSITLNAKELDIQSAYVAVGATKYIATDIIYDAQLERATFKFDGTLHAGTTAALHVVFTGIHNDKMSGFYRSGYKDDKGEQKYMVVTQFEATHARKAFPCWDEPAIKATFDVTLTVKDELTALSNMNDVEETDHQDGWKSVRFAKTPVMSTYLLAFAVGEFEYIEKNTSGEHNGRPVRIRVYSLPGLSNQGHFSLDCACKTLEFFAGVFGIAYPLPKMDMIAVPDFDAGAMENWGLVTYRTVLLLWDPKTSSASTKQSIAYVVAHELAHQWFGNLVTMEWWSELWLNEGFATWVGWLAVDHLFPEWDIWTSFVSDEMQRGMGLDAMRSSHPIQVELASASQISQIFDAISYSKGASVIRMLSSYLGQDTFLAGIRRYLKRHKYSNASTNDLWAALSEESGRDVKQFMQLWTLKIGHPVLHVTDNADGTFHVKQNRFLSTGDARTEEDETIWWCPLNLVTEAGPAHALSEKDSVLMGREATYKKPAGQFFKLNYKHSGFYRVHYSKDKLRQLGRAISDGRLSTSDRLGILADAASLAESGVGGTADLLELIGHFEDEKEFIVWNEIAARLESLRSVWFEEPALVRDALQRLEQKLFSKLAHRLGWDYPEGEDMLTSKLRTLAISKAGRAGDDVIVKEAKRRFDLFIGEDASALHPNIRGNALAIVVTHGGPAEWDAVLQVYRATTTADQKIMALAALGAARHPETIQRALELSLSSDVRPQDTMYLYNSIGSTPEGRYPLWKFVQANWSEYERMYAGSMGLFGHVVKASTSRFSKEEMAREIESFFAKKDTTHVQRPLEQSLEKLRVNAKWLTRARKDVAAWAKESGI